MLLYFEEGKPTPNQPTEPLIQIPSAVFWFEQNKRNVVDSSNGLFVQTPRADQEKRVVVLRKQREAAAGAALSGSSPLLLQQQVTLNGADPVLGWGKLWLQFQCRVVPLHCLLKLLLE